MVDAPDETEEEKANTRRVVENLLDRLLYKGVLPRYAFPTDVVSFYVFDRDRSTQLPDRIPIRTEPRAADSADAVRPGQGGVGRREAVALRCHLFSDVGRSV